MQVGVTGARVAMVERGGEEPASLDLRLAPVADPGKGGLAFQPGQGVGDRVVVGGIDLVAGRGRTEGPEQRDALDGREHQVVAGDRATVPASLLGLVG